MNWKELGYYMEEGGYTSEMLSEASGVRMQMIEGILDGTIGFPGYRTMQALERVLQPDKEPGCVREAEPVYAKKQGTYTLEDYYAITDERRVELIDGVIYDMTAPTAPHQIIAARMYYIIQNYIDSKKGKCRVFISPLDVQLDCDNRTMVQPDVIILCDMDKYTERCLVGAPDFLVEVLSPGTRKKDSSVKLRKYRNAGVKEYWMIDLAGRRVIVYCFEEKEEPTIYGFDSKIPVGIYGGDLLIDFQRIEKELKIEKPRRARNRRAQSLAGDGSDNQ